MRVEMHVCARNFLCPHAPKEGNASSLRSVQIKQRWWSPTTRPKRLSLRLPPARRLMPTVAPTTFHNLNSAIMITPTNFQFPAAQHPSFEATNDDDHPRQDHP